MFARLLLGSALLAGCALASYAEEKTPPVLDAKMSVKVGAGSASATEKVLPVAVTFENRSGKEQKFDNGFYRIVLLDRDGVQIDDALEFTTELRTITIKGRSVTDRPGVYVKKGKLKEGEGYYLVVSVRNLTALAKFKATR